MVYVLEVNCEVVGVEQAVFVILIEYGPVAPDIENVATPLQSPEQEAS